MPVLGFGKRKNNRLYKIFSLMKGGFLISHTLPETNSSPLKMDGWNTILSYWGDLFSGAFAVSFREVKKMKVSPNRISIRSTPHPVTVTTRIITFLVGNPYKPSFATVTGWGVDPKFPYFHPCFFWASPLEKFPYGMDFCPILLPDHGCRFNITNKNPKGITENHQAKNIAQQIPLFCPPPEKK